MRLIWRGGRARRAAATAVCLGVAAFGAAAALGAGTGAHDGAPPPLTIGALFSLTGGGNVYGPQQEKGARLAIEQINADGGVDGVPLKLVVRDDTSVPGTGKATMRRLIQSDHAVAVLGPTLSLVAVSADPVADRLQTPVVAVSNTAEGIVGTCAYDCTWIWRDSLGEETAVPANIDEYVLEQHPSTAAILYVADDKLGVEEGRIAASSFSEAGVRVVANAELPATGSVDAVVAAALRRHPQVIFVGASFGQRAADTMKAARTAGFKGAFLGGNTLNSETTAQLAAPQGAGARSGAAWYAGNDFPANRDFITSYRQTYGEAPDQFAAQAFVGVEIVADALRRGHVATSSASLADRRAALQKALRDVALTTPLGPFRFTRDHDVEQIVWVLAMTADGGHELAGFCNPSC
jgi:branched-chain amino acid transport system substrate-binding protein